DIEPDVSPTAGHGAAVSVPRHHLLALAGRDGRGRPLRHGGIDRAELAGVARRALDHGRIDLEIPTAAVLPGPLAIGALLDRDLVGGRAGLVAPTGVAVRPAEHRLDQLVVCETLPVLLGSERVQLAPDVIPLGRDLDR